THHHFFLVARQPRATQGDADALPDAVVIPAQPRIHEADDVGHIVWHGVVELMLERFARQHVAIETHVEMRSTTHTTHARHSGSPALQVEADADIGQVQAVQFLGLGEGNLAAFLDLTNLVLHVASGVVLQCLYYAGTRFLRQPLTDNLESVSFYEVAPILVEIDHLASNISQHPAS